MKSLLQVHLHLLFTGSRSFFLDPKAKSPNILIQNSLSKIVVGFVNVITKNLDSELWRGGSSLSPPPPPPHLHPHPQHHRCQDLVLSTFLLFAIRLTWRFFFSIVVFKVQENATEQNVMPAVRRLNVELTKEKLDTMLDGLGKIRDQLSSVSK